MYKSLIALCFLLSSTASQALELAHISIGENFDSVKQKEKYLDDGTNRLYFRQGNLLIKIKGTEEQKVKQIKVAHAILDKDFYTVLGEYKNRYPLHPCLQESKLELKSIREKGYGKVHCELKDEHSTLKLTISTYASQVTVKARLDPIAAK